MWRRPVRCTVRVAAAQSPVVLFPIHHHGDQQGPVCRNGHSHRTSVNLLTRRIRDESAKEGRRYPGRRAVVKRDTHHLVAAPEVPVPRTVPREERAVPAGRRKLLPLVENELQRGYAWLPSGSADRPSESPPGGGRSR